MHNIFRRTLGLAVNLAAWLMRPEPIPRSEQERRRLAHELKGLRLYDYKGCPSSLKLRQALHRLNIDIDYCDIRRCQVHHDNLLAQLGRLHAPCLRIEEHGSVRWLEDAGAIIDYLNGRFDTRAAPRALAPLSE